MVQIQLLGPPGVRDEQGQRKVAGRQRALLAALALAAPRSVSADRLIDVIWGDDPPADPVNALQQRISALRRVVDPERRGDVLVTGAGGYALRIDDDAVDARRFASLAAEGRELLAAGDARAANRQLAAALELWRGPALDGVDHEPWAVAEAQRLTELRLVATEDRVDAALALGAGSELVGELTDHLAGHPLRERLCAQLMLALYRSGRQADALALYDRTRRLLAEELGIDPGPALQERHRQVLAQDPALDHGPLAPAGAPAGTSPGNLPAPTVEVIGRGRALEQVGELLGHGRLVTLTGPGGAGKTTLAVEAARRHEPPPDGRWLVELAPVTGTEAVPPTVADALGIGSGGLGASGITAVSLAAALAGRELLVVLDNCEHLVGAVAPLVEHLLTRAPGLRVLATSREALGVPGELVWSVPALGVPDEDAITADEVRGAPAVALLEARARQHAPGFTITDATAPFAARVVRQLDGIPLAIELAGARLRVLSLPELADGLADRFALLTSPVRAAPSRQRTLRGALDWSWELLSAEQQAAWAALSVPASWFDRPTAAALLDAAEVEGHHLDVLAELVDRSLVTADTGSAGTRYRLLETIRAYGRDRLDTLHIAEQVRARHADVVGDALARAAGTTDPARFGIDLGGLAAWLDDARAALAWATATGDRGRTQRIAGSLGWVWWLRGLATEGLGWLDRGLGDPAAADPGEVDPGAALWASGLRTVAPTAVDAGPWIELSLRVAADPTGRVLATMFRAIHLARMGRADDCAAALAEARRLAGPAGGWPLGLVLLTAAQLARLTGRLDQVLPDAEAALELLTAAEVDWARASAMDLVIEGLDATGDHERAVVLATEGLELCRRSRAPELEARMQLQLGRALHELDRVEEARQHLDRAVELAATGGAGLGLGFALVVAGAAARSRGELDAARRQLEQALPLLEGGAGAFGQSWARAELSLVAVLDGDATSALRHGREALHLATEVGQPDTIARALEAVAAALACGDSPQDAVPVLGAARALRDGAASPTSVSEQREIERIVTVLHARLGATVDELLAAAAADAAGDLQRVVGQLVSAHGATPGG